jgi:hypothetical protein
METDGKAEEKVKRQKNYKITPLFPTNTNKLYNKLIY